ncbi:DUF6531 domain-containing protein [Terrilactibacillus sp. S3-3]|nr:DUF6531 domain-containing protein [Terrilactibacillus sp. S3-3]
MDPVTNKGALTIKWDAVSGAGGYKVELFDGKAYKSFDVGKVTSWNTSGQTLFNDVKDLPADPTLAYQENGAAQSFIDKKAYQFRVKAYRYNDETAPSSEQEKMSGERGLSGPSSTAYSSIPMREDLLGLEDSFTYGTHEMGNADISVNVTTNMVMMKVTDQSLFTRGPLDFDLTRTYNSRSNRPSAFGNGWTFAGNESLTKKDTSDNATLYYEDEDGTRHEFDYDTSKNAYVSPKGKYLTLTKETVNGAAGYRLKDTDGFSKLFEQDPSDAARYRLSAYQDANKNRILFKHTGDQLTEIAEVDDSGNTVRNSIKLSYTDGLMITAVTFKDRSINYQYDHHQLVKTTIKASGTSKTLTNSFDYDEDGQMSEYTDSKGNVDTISYDDHQLTLLEPQKSGAESVSTTYSYDDKNNTFEASDTGGRTTIYKRDKDHNTYTVIETENADGTTSKVTEDANYNVLSETDENGKTATHTYDDRGNVLSDTDKEGRPPLTVMMIKIM